jgi:UDPglucose--hexose-1-phosphate uridylyltransferase
MNEWRTRPHRRFNPLRGEWVLVSPHRLQRPWQGAVSVPPGAGREQYDPECYLCPGNVRASGASNPRYEHTFVFDNDYAALLMDTPEQTYEDGLLLAHSERGRCRVVCFSPRHDLDISQMAAPDIALVIDTWAQQYQALGTDSGINAVTIFENRGAMMGASNPHPHGQIWAQATVPDELAKEMHSQRDYAATNSSCLLCDYAAKEIALQERLVYVNEHALVVVPFWATWPFETMVIPRRHTTDISALEAEERLALAQALHELTSRYDRVFDVPFPYSMGFHQRPTDGSAHDEWHAHAHYFPPLLRSANVRKYMVGYELLAQPQRDITAEQTAQRLREL